MKKTLDYYMALSYPIEITMIPVEEGGGCSACIPLLGRYSCVADGETVEEAVENLKEVKQDLLKDLLERGVGIPEPQSQKESEFSGRLLIRMPSSLHMQISEKAESRGESLNKYVISVLLADVKQDLVNHLEGLLMGFSKSVEALRNQMTPCHISQTNTYVGKVKQSFFGIIGNSASIPNPYFFPGVEGQSGFDLLASPSRMAECQEMLSISDVQRIDR
jgi:predicted HicB family RNase H-like nuclease